MNIIAFDPGIANTGVAWQIGSSLFHKTIKTSPREDIPSRILHTTGDLIGLTHHRWDCCVIEDYVGPWGKPTKLLLGALIQWVGNFSNKVNIVHPKIWVKDLFGKKQDYKLAANKLCKKLGYKPSTQHETDALCLLEWSKQSYCIVNTRIKWSKQYGTTFKKS